MDLAAVVDPACITATTRYFSARRSYENQAGEEHTVTIVGIDELDPLNGKISWISPVARALTKAREGESVMLQTPGGIEELEVLRSVIRPDNRLNQAHC